MLTTNVKAGAITNLTDARYFAAQGVNWLGYCLDPAAAEYLSPLKINAIREWVEGPKTVGEFGYQSIEEIVGYIQKMELDAIHIQQFTPSATIKASIDVPVFQEWIADSADSLRQLHKICRANQDSVDFFILNFSKNRIRFPEQAEAEYLQILKEICQNYPVYLDLPASSEKLLAMLEFIAPAGIHIKGGEEEKVGFKSFDEVDDLFELLQTE